MTTRLFQRLFSLALSLLLTVAMLGGIDQLSQRDEQPAQWALGTATRA